MASGTTIIVGAAGSIGSACVQEFLTVSDRIVAIDKSPMPHREQVQSHQVDVTSGEALAAIPKEPIRNLVYTAGILSFGSLLNTSTEEFNHVFHANVLGAMMTLKHFVPSMESGGSIVIISSISGRVGFPGLSLYSASKAALGGLVRSAAAELGPRGIRINAIEPTNVEGPMLESELKERSEAGEGSIEELRRIYTTDQAIHRFADPREIARLCRLLCDGDLGLLTGASIPYDGGLSS